MDIKGNKQVCVIGDYLNRVAFGGNGLGQTLKIGANKFRIVGVLAAKVSDPDMFARIFSFSLSMCSCSCFLMRVVRVLVIMDTTSIAMPENRFSGRVKLKAK